MTGPDAQAAGMLAESWTSNDSAFNNILIPVRHLRADAEETEMSFVFKTGVRIYQIVILVCLNSFCRNMILIPAELCVLVLHHIQQTWWFGFNSVINAALRLQIDKLGNVGLTQALISNFLR